MQLKHVFGKYDIIMFKLGKYGIAPKKINKKRTITIQLTRSFCAIDHPWSSDGETLIWIADKSKYSIT